MYNFDYFYGNEAEQYQFYMIPQLLFTDDKFRKLSSDAKILYGLLLDRSGLSFRNKEVFTDENGRTFIYFTQETAMEMLNCAKEKITKTFKELETIGLIEKKRQGLGKPTKIYVKHFNRLITEDKNYKETVELQEVRKSNFKEFENRTSESSEIKLQKVRKSNSNQTNINQTNINQTNISQSVSQSTAEKAPAKKNETDGQTDGQKKSMPFSQVLKEIGFDTYGIDFEPTSEKEFQEFEEEDRKTSGCAIPYSLKTDKKAMKEALKFLFAYSCYAPAMSDGDRRLFDTVISTLTAMTEKDLQEYQGQKVRYSDVIDRLNDVIHSPDGSLYDWYISFEQQWNKILTENDIKHQKAYMKSCIWNWLNDYAFEDDNNLRKLEYNLRHGAI